MSSPMRVDREVMRGWGGGRVYITHGHTVCVRHAHARNTPDEHWARWTCVRSTLHGCALTVRYVCAGPQSTNTQRMPSVCSACVWRWSALCAWLASFWRVHSGVELRAQFCACTKIPTHTTNDDECTALVQRARRTSSAR